MEERKTEKLHHMPHIGKRKMKSVLAVFLGFCLWQVVRLFFPALEVHPLYIYLYGIIEIRDSSAKTVDMGSRRIKATFVGLGLGLPMLALAEYLRGLMPTDLLRSLIELALILLGVLLALMIAELLGCESFCGIAAIIFVIMMVSHSHGEQYIYSVLRAVQTMMGVFVAWLINVKWFPYPGPVKEEAHGGKEQLPCADVKG